METSWYDLPLEMKREIIKHTNSRDRLVLAQTFPEVFSLDVYEKPNLLLKVYFEKTKRTSEYENRIEHDYLLSIGPRGKKGRVEIEFKKIEDVCEIRWNWCENVIRSKFFNTRDVTKLAFDYFESILERFKNSLENLILKKIDINFCKTTIPHFPKLKSLQITTNNEKTVYWLLSKSPNLQSLKLSFRQFEKSKAEQEPLADWKLDKLLRLEVETNVKSIAENILLRSENARLPKFKFYGDDYPHQNSIVLRMHTVRHLDTSAILSSEQFFRMKKWYQYVRCDRGNITNGGINKMIDSIMNCSRAMERFCIHHVGADILKARSFDFKRIDTKKDPNTGGIIRCAPFYKYERIKTNPYNVEERVGVLSYYEQKGVLTFELMKDEVMPPPRLRPTQGHGLSQFGGEGFA